MVVGVEFLQRIADDVSLVIEIHPFTCKVRIVTAQFRRRHVYGFAEVFVAQAPQRDGAAHSVEHGQCLPASEWSIAQLFEHYFEDALALLDVLQLAPLVKDVHQHLVLVLEELLGLVDLGLDVVLVGLGALVLFARRTHVKVDLPSGS